MSKQLLLVVMGAAVLLAMCGSASAHVAIGNVTWGNVTSAYNTSIMSVATTNVTANSSANNLTCMVSFEGTNHAMTQTTSAGDYIYYHSVALVKATNYTTINVSCWNSTGTNGTSSNYWLYADGTAPIIVWGSFAARNGTTVTSPQNAVFTTDEAANCTINLNGVTTTDTSNTAHSISMVQTTNSNLTFYATCSDALNNVRTSGTGWWKYFPQADALPGVVPGGTPSTSPPVEDEPPPSIDAAPIIAEATGQVDGIDIGGVHLSSQMLMLIGGVVVVFFLMRR